MQLDGDEEEGWTQYSQWLQGQSEEKIETVIDEQDILYQMYTSGTTGLPKGGFVKPLCGHD